MNKLLYFFFSAFRFHILPDPLFGVCALKPCQNYLKGYSDNYVLFVLQILYSIPFICICIVLFHFGMGLEWNVTYRTTANNLHFHR